MLQPFNKTEQSLAPGKAELQLNLMEQEQASGGMTGSASLLTQGLKIEEAQ
jgi:hypothetical protein